MMIELGRRYLPWLVWAGLCVGVGVAACDTAGGDGGSDAAGGSAGGGDGAGGGGPGGGVSTSNGMMGTCDSGPWTDDAACEECLETSCCFALNACEVGSDCIAFEACSAACAGDTGCELACATMHESGVVAVQALAACNSDSCGDCATLPRTEFSCAGVLAEHQGAPFAACAETECCSEVIACDADASCDVAEALSGDCASSVLCDCIFDKCTP